MAPRFLADENLNLRIIAGLQRRERATISGPPGRPESLACQTRKSSLRRHDWVACWSRTTGKRCLRTLPGPSRSSKPAAPDHFAERPNTGHH